MHVVSAIRKQTLSIADKNSFNDDYCFELLSLVSGVISKLSLVSGVISLVSGVIFLVSVVISLVSGVISKLSIGI